MNPHYSQVATRASHRCEYCRAPERLFNKELEVEHIIPRVLGGPDEPDNLALCCRRCNGSKGEFIDGYDDATTQNVRLFHPRRDQWDDHFEFISENAEIVGKTPVGRVTVSRLKMNIAKQVSARKIWSYYGEY